jgi:hypothetical protein
MTGFSYLFTRREDGDIEIDLSPDDETRPAFAATIAAEVAAEMAVSLALAAGVTP